MTEVSVSVSPATPVSPQQPQDEPIAVRVEIQTHARTTVPLLLPGKESRTLVGEGAIWRPHRRSLEGTLGYLTIEPGALIDVDGNRVLLVPASGAPNRRNEDWDDFDPNAEPEPGIDSGHFNYWFGRNYSRKMKWARMQSMSGHIVWEGFAHRRGEFTQTCFARFTVPADSEVGLLEKCSWSHPDSGIAAGYGFRGEINPSAILLDRKIRIVSTGAIVEENIDVNVAIVEKWTGKTWLGATLPSEPVISKEDAMRYVQAHTFRSDVNQSGAYTRAGNPSAYVLWPIGGGDSRIAKALLEQAKSDFWSRPIWLRNQPEDWEQSAYEAFNYLYLPGRTPRGVVTFHEENPWIGRDPATAPIEAKLGWDFLTHAHLRADGVDNQHEGLWLLASSYALTGSLWSEVMLRANAARLMFDRNWEVARTAGSLKWIQNGRGRGRPIEALVEIAATILDGALRNVIFTTIGEWVALRIARRADLGFDRGAAAQWLSRDTSRRDQSFFTGYEEAIDALALWRAFSLDPDASARLLREVIVQGRIAASSMRTFDGGQTWQSGYHVQAMDDGSMGPMIGPAGPDLRFSSIGGLRAYIAAAIFAAKHFPQHLDPIDSGLLQVAQRAIAYFESLPIQTPGSAAETLFALGQGARGVDAKAMAEGTNFVPVEQQG